MKLTREQTFEIDVAALSELYKKALKSENKASIEAAENTVLLAIDAEAAATRLTIAEAAADML